jgi:hypothetical protein
MELKIKKETAKKIYADAPDSLKEILVETFGKDCFKTRKFNDIKTFDDACEELGLYQEDLLNIGGNDTPDEEAYKKLKIIAKAINQGWIPDWNNSNQYKWYPYFNLSSGFGFSFTCYCCALTCSSVGSRLCFETEEKAAYAGKQFLSLYKDFLTLTK